MLVFRKKEKLRALAYNKKESPTTAVVRTKNTYVSFGLFKPFEHSMARVKNFMYGSKTRNPKEGGKAIHGCRNLPCTSWHHSVSKHALEMRTPR